MNKANYSDMPTDYIEMINANALAGVEQIDADADSVAIYRINMVDTMLEQGCTSGWIIMAAIDAYDARVVALKSKGKVYHVFGSKGVEIAAPNYYSIRNLIDWLNDHMSNILWTVKDAKGNIVATSGE